MTYAERRNLALILLAVFIALILLTACGTTHHHALPAYEPPLTKTDFQHVRTTAYTHTEADHRQYSNHNALGGELHAAGPAIHRAEVVTRATLAYEVPRAIPVDENGSYSPPLQRFSMEESWALSGRNTIDLYMANQRAMNTWGARQETIEVLKWGDPQESLQFLRRHQDYRHIKRMVLELEGHEKEAASLR